MRTKHLTATQVDHLGDRLRPRSLPATDLELLDIYRESFQDAYRKVVNMVRVVTDGEPTGRPGKSTSAIVDKLNRGTMRLSQMQDIAGCRLIVEDFHAQQFAVQKLQENLAPLGTIHVDDRLALPSHGYRAVHLLVTVDGKVVEVQVRTLFQHLWAELSETAADRYGVQVKYGGEAPGRPEVRETLDIMSETLADAELPGADPETSESMKSFVAALAVLMGGLIIGREET
jgi:ppGpp synthetase/RelA/SpoT-type nucleotidyltranferase